MTSQTDLSDAQRWALYSRWLNAPDGAVLANALICLIHQASFLLDRQIAALERAFVEEGGYSEQLANARLAERRKRDRPDLADSAYLGKIPACPMCGGQMAPRTAKTGPNTGKQFWGCTTSLTSFPLASKAPRRKLLPCSRHFVNISATTPFAVGRSR